MWFKDEKFWRDVGSRTLAAVIAAGIIYGFALAAGYVARPNVWRTVGLAATVSVYIYLNWRLSRRTRRKHAEARREYARRSMQGQLSGTSKTPKQAASDRSMRRSDVLLFIQTLILLSGAISSIAAVILITRPS
jgi:hypothetical protein